MSKEIDPRLLPDLNQLHEICTSNEALDALSEHLDSLPEAADAFDEQDFYDMEF